MIKWKNTELTKNYSKLLDSQQENSQLINYKIYELNSKISALQVLAQKNKQKDNQTTKQIVLEEYYNDQPYCLQVFYTWTASLFYITSYI